MDAYTLTNISLAAVFTISTCIVTGILGTRDHVKRVLLADTMYVLVAALIGLWVTEGNVRGFRCRFMNSTTTVSSKTRKTDVPGQSVPEQLCFVLRVVIGDAGLDRPVKQAPSATGSSDADNRDHA
jgi:hypothetical protein